MKNSSNMRRFWLRRGLRFLSFGVLFVGVSGLAVMSLWNALLPAILGVSAITFGQAIGLMILSRLLFGGFRPGGFGPGREWRGGFGPGGWGESRRGEWKQKMADRWATLTPDQREQMRAQWRDRCGHGRRGHGPRPDRTDEPATQPTGAGETKTV